jgi:hypothetical protein
VKLIKDYDCMIDYHPRRENVVANALSHKNKVDDTQMIVMKENYWN